MGFESMHQSEGEQEESAEVLEGEINALFSRLPPELKNRFLDANEELSSHELRDALKEKIANRERALRPHASEESIRILETPPASFESAMLTIVARAQEVGRGENGRVIVDTNGNPLAYKVLIRAPLKGQNSLIEEARMQAGIHAVAMQHPESRMGVPAVEYFLSTSRVEVIAMELLDAISIEDVLTDREALPPGTDIESVFAHLSRFLTIMHDEGYYHMDLRPGNIMLPKRPSPDTPVAYIVDMGQAVSRNDVTRGYQVGSAGLITYDIDKDPDYVTMQKAKDALISHTGN